MFVTQNHKGTQVLTHNPGHKFPRYFSRYHLHGPLSDRAVIQLLIYVHTQHHPSCAILWKRVFSKTKQQMKIESINSSNLCSIVKKKSIMGIKIERTKTIAWMNYFQKHFDKHSEPVNVILKLFGKFFFFFKKTFSILLLSPGRYQSFPSFTFFENDVHG